MGRLNIVSADADRELDALRSTIASFDTATGLDELCAVLSGHAERGERAQVLDLIGHSCGPGFVVIGSWVIDDSPQTAASFSELLRPWLVQLGIRTVRLLGCSTAMTDRARSAMRRIGQRTRCLVLGTRRYISKRDYGPVGFIADETLLGADGSPAPFGLP